MSKLLNRMCVRSVHFENFIKTGILMLALISIVFLIPTGHARAASLTIKYDGKKQTYTGTQAKVTLDGKSVSLGKSPGIIISNTCMLPFREVFINKLGAEYTYDSSKGTIVIEQNGIIIQMTINSKTAYVNGVKKTLDVAPKKIKLCDINKTKVYVPARFVAENLGYDYTWVSTSKTSQLISPLKLKYDKNAADFTMYTGIKAQVSCNGSSVNLGNMPGLFVNDTLLVQAKKVFSKTLGAEYSYNSTDRTITLKRNDITIVMTIDSNIAMVNNTPYVMDTEARMMTLKKNNTSYVMVPAAFTAATLGYGYSWNPNTKTAAITRIESDYTALNWDEELLVSSAYMNMVTDVRVSHKENTDILSVTGISDLNINITEDRSSTALQIEIFDVYNEISECHKVFTDGIFTNGITVAASANGITINLNKNADCSYYTSQSGNTFQLILCENAAANITGSAYQIKLTLPEELEFSYLTDEDRYYENTFIITIPGDYTEYFSQNPVSYDPSVIEQISVTVNDAGNTEIKVNTYELQGYRLNDCGDYIGIFVAKPNQVYKNIVVLDAGHGGKDPGSSASSVSEKNLNLSIIYDFAKEYFNSKDSEIKAYWTRTDDTYVTLENRAAFAKKVGADLFISLHMNSATSKTAKGTEVLYAATNSNVMSDLTSKGMADIFQKQLIADLNLTNRGIKDRPNLVVLKSNSVPAVLIELGFISNSSDFKKLTDGEFQQKAAASIYEAAKTCFSLYPTGR